MKKAVISKSFLKSLRKIDNKFKEEIKKRIKQILIEPTIGIPLKQNLKGMWKYRLSKYRIIYKYDLENVYFVSVNLRKKAYK